MASPPRRPTSAHDAAEALFKPKKPVTAPVIERAAVPGGREQVSLRLDSDVLAYFQGDGPGWQDRINQALRAAMKTGK